MYYLYIFIFLIFRIATSNCANHWTVTDDGLTIQSVPESLYMMKQPHSLVQFLGQEQKLEEIARFKKSFVENEEAIRARESFDDPDLEKNIRENDADCQIAKELTTNKDLFLVSYSLIDPLDDLEYVAEGITPVDQAGTKDVPYCKIDLPFSMHAFEHFPSMQQRKIISVPPETELNKTFPSRFQLDDLGHYVSVALEKEPASPPVLNLAGLYWRIRGSAANAVECFRRSLHFSAREKQTRIWFSLANIFHKAGFSADAVTLYQLVLSELDQALVHLALGDALTLMLNRTEAIKEYELAHSMDSSLKAIYKASALKCDLKLIKEMEMQHSNLEQTIILKNLQKQRFDRVKQLEELVRKNAADGDTRMQSNFVYDYFTYGSLPYVDCRTLEHSGKLMMHCYLRDNDYLHYKKAVELRHLKMVKEAIRRPPPQARKIKLETVEDENSESAELSAFLEAIKPMHGATMDEPITKPLYPLQADSRRSKLVEKYLNEDWPNRTVCEANRLLVLPFTQANFPQFFISPDNKGFRVADLLGKYLRLSPLQEHPLPWNPPFCDGFLPSEKHPASSLFRLKGVIRAASRGRSDKFAEKNLKSVFKQLAGTEGVIADLAQRIHTLMHHNIGPRWLVFNLAALYWRVVGAPGLAAECLHASLGSNPNNYADVALSQLAQLVLRSAVTDEHLDDAGVILNMAVLLDPNEPSTHVLYGIVNYLQKKRLTAMKYARAAVILNPDFHPAIKFMHSLKCYNKLPGEFVKEPTWLQCCNSIDANVYCFRSPFEGCFIVHNSNGIVEKIRCRKKTPRKAVCYRGSHFVLLLAPSIKFNITEGEERLRHFRYQYNEGRENAADVIPLDYGSEQCLKKIKELPSSLVPTFPVSQTKILYANVKETASMLNETWEEDVLVDLIPFPEFPLSSSQVTERRQMIVYDAVVPEVLPLPSRELVESGLNILPMSKVLDRNYCANMKTTLPMLREQATSTWVSVTAKGVNMEEFMDLNAPVPALAGFEPVCPELDAPSPLKTFDHLPAYHLRDQFIFYKPEIGLEKAFKSLGNERERIEHVAGRLMLAMKVSKLNTNSKESQDAGVHWTLSTASTLYWRVKGDAVNAIKCLRHSLNNAPPDMMDVALVSMANIYHQAGLLHSALISGGAALTVSPKLVAVHVTLADIYASMGDYQHALQFYYSTLSLQRNFGPAKDRIRAIYCHTGKTIEF